MYLAKLNYLLLQEAQLQEGTWYMVHRPESSVSPEILSKMQTLRTQDILNQTLYFNMIARWFACMLKLESTGVTEKSMTKQTQVLLSFIHIW